MDIYLSTYAKSMYVFTAFIYAVLCLRQSLAYPTGAPLVACQEMRPYHPPSTTSGSPPFAINLTQTFYKPGSEIKGTIYSTTGVIFRGFLIQARKADNSEVTPFGEFIVSGTDTHTNCGVENKQGLTHTTNSNKTEIDFTWKAPKSYQGDLHFKLTIVESYNVSRYWLGIYSSVIKDCSLHPSSDCDDITTQLPETTTASDVTLSTETKPSSARPITSPSPQSKIPKDPECGISKGCFPDCSNGCQYLVTWQNASNSVDKNDNVNAAAVHFQLQMILEEKENVWIAIGLSPTGNMDGTNVIACLTGSDNVTVESSHNEGYSNVLYSAKTLGLSNMQGSVEGEKIECSFTRKLAMNVTDFINLEDEMYLLVGHGPISKGIKQQHTQIPVKSLGKINFLSSSDSITTEKPEPVTGSSPAKPTTSPAPQNNIPNDPECGISKGCFPDCSNGCQYLVTWQYLSGENNYNTAADEETGVHFEFKMILDEIENVWIAIGLSPTGKMDDTNVIACLTGSSTVSVESSHNEGYSNVLYIKKSLGLSNMQGSVEGKKIECSFTRKLAMNVTDFINLKEETYLLVGHGTVSNGIKQKHSQDPARSSEKVNFLSNKVTKESNSATALIKLHGSLMVVAWVLCSSIGVVIARHFKSMAHGKMMCNVRYWFAIHRTIMFTVVLCVIVAFVAIFYEIGGFSQISPEPGQEYTKAHPYLGIIVTCLTLLNPIMALFRPPVDHQNRPIFNWAHFSVGTAAHIISVVTIFFGIKLSKAQVDEYATDVMIAYSVIFVIVQLILEIHRKRSPTKGSVTYGKLNSNSAKQYLLTASESSTTYRAITPDMSINEKEGVSMFSTIVLFLHGVCMVVAATLLILMICDPTHFHPKK